MRLNHILIVCALLCLRFACAQEFQGIATYQSKTTLDINLEGRRIPEDRKAQIMERMKKGMERTYDLNFDKTASLYTEQQALETPNTDSRGGRFRIMMGGSTGIYYKDIQAKTFKNQQELFGKVFLVVDSLEPWQWKLGSETKKIGNYTAYKATAIKKIDTSKTNQFRRFGPPPPPGDEEKKAQEKDSTGAKTENTLFNRMEQPTEKEIVAWYTPEIPVSTGPGNYWGLPGLILEVHDDKTVILCSKLVLNPTEKSKIEAPKKGKEVTQAEYDEIVADKMKEMSERFRGGNRGRQGGFRPRG
ncbi:GLPGLI family protein [Croceivirga sp. JEA036]|uniref:GLPGLI family protein n=1 Tax=Croceivirga sp. JEA036 TaxID=2721162 RepID=UPI001439D8D7|nr:GLPGLI family protein [Croceivirga sp. JEA036]NJB36141.1 GLPGLI family protein [Croceivirga sp. JEA036]